MLCDSSKASSKAIKKSAWGVLKTELYGRMPCRASQESQKSVNRAVAHQSPRQQSLFGERQEGSGRSDS